MIGSGKEVREGSDLINKYLTYQFSPTIFLDSNSTIISFSNTFRDILEIVERPEREPEASEPRETAREELLLWYDQQGDTERFKPDRDTFRAPIPSGGVRR